MTRRWSVRCVSDVEVLGQPSEMREVSYKFVECERPLLDRLENGPTFGVPSFPRVQRK